MRMKNEPSLKAPAASPIVTAYMKRKNPNALSLTSQSVKLTSKKAGLDKTTT